MEYERALIYASEKVGGSREQTPVVAYVKDLYGSFYDDYKKIKSAVRLFSSLVDRQPLWAVVDDLIKKSKEEELCLYDHANLEVYISNLFGSYLDVLSLLRELATDEIFKKVKNMLYNENRTFRLLYEAKYIFRPRKSVDLFYKDGELYLNIPNTISDHEISEEMYENAFKGLDDVKVETLWCDYKHMQCRFVEYLILAIISEKQLKRFYNCVKVYEKDDDSLILATFVDNCTYNECIKVDKIRELISAYENIPISDRNKITRLMSDCE